MGEENVEGKGDKTSETE